MVEVLGLYAMYYLYPKMSPCGLMLLLRIFQIRGHFGYCRSNITILLEVPKARSSRARMLLYFAPTGKGHTCDYTCLLMLTLMIPQRL